MFKQVKKNGFEKSKAATKKLEELEMDASDMHFSHKAQLRRKKKVKKHFDYEYNDESVNEPEKNYCINFFNVLMNQAIMTTEECFQ